MKKVYLVDSENVGDIWVPLLVSTQPEDDVLVFYTLKSPHMNYENVRLLTQTEKEAVFIKCFEGNNALDFQLVSELGYRLCADSDAAYIIVSNDTGFDAVVRYWSAKDCPVSRMNGKDCRRMLQELKREGRTAASEAVAEDEEEPFDDEVCVREDAPETAEHAEDGSTEQEDAHGADMSREPAEHDKIVEAHQQGESGGFPQCAGRISGRGGGQGALSGDEEQCPAGGLLVCSSEKEPEGKI